MSKTGERQLQEWIKQSLRDIPFSTVKGKLWTRTQSSIPLKKIYTKLNWVHKDTLLFDIELFDITEIFEDQEFTEKSSIRILVQGIT